jgi:hypothetical protein
MPRPRPVPAAPALPTPAPTPTPSPAPVASAPERARSGTLLGVAALPKAPPPSTQEGETRVDASPFGAGGTGTGFDASETTSTAVRPGAKTKSTLLPPSEDEPTHVADLPTSNGEDGPTDVQRALPPATTRQPTPLFGLPASETPPWGTPLDTPMPPAKGAKGPPAVPLPPPPGGALPSVRSDPPETMTNPAGTLSPEMRTTETSIPGSMDTPLSPVAGEGGEDPEVPPMPLPPAPGILPAVQYLLPLARAVWARIGAQRALRDKLHGDQRLLDDTLHELGRAAWTESARPAELREELGRADEDEGRRKHCETEVARIDGDVVAERQRFTEDEERRKGDIAAREGEVARLVEDLAERRRAQRIEEKVAREVEARLRAAEKQVSQLQAKAARAEVTPPEKGGGTNTAANFRQQAEAAQREADGFRPDCEAAEARVRALDAPIGELEQKLMQERGGLAGAQTELEAVRKAHHDAILALEQERAQNVDTAAIAEKSIRLRLVSTGTILSLHRLDGPQHQKKFAPIYERLDHLKQIASAREQRMNQLDAERHGYDRAALQRGLIVVGGGVGVLLILLVIVIVVASR